MAKKAKSPKVGNVRWLTFNDIIDTSPAKLTESSSLHNKSGPVRFTAADKLVFLTIFRGAKNRIYNDERGYYSTESVRQIAEMTGLNRETVIISVKKWVAVCMLKIARQGTAPGSSTVYKVRHFNIQKAEKQ